MPKKELFNNLPYMRAWEETLNGSRYTFVKTGPAVVVFPLKRENGKLYILLAEELRDTGKRELKSIGGYCRVDETYRDCAKRKLGEEGGISADSIQYFGKCIGYTVVKLPIKFYYTFDWRWDVPPGVGLHSLVVSIEQAVDMVMRYEIDDEAAAMAIFRLAELEKRGLLE